MTEASDPFDQLRDDGATSVPPDRRFVARLRFQLENALADSTPTIPLPDRKQQTMSTTSTTSEFTTTTPAVQILTPYIAVHDGAAALDWYSEAFGAVETVRYVGDDGRLGHAEFTFNGARVMLSDAYPEIGVVAANSYDGSSCALHVEVSDCDAVHDRAVAAGATSAAPPNDQPHGARAATIIDPFGHRWMLSQQLSSPTSAEIDDAYDDFTVIERDDPSD